MSFRLQALAVHHRGAALQVLDDTVRDALGIPADMVTMLPACSVEDRVDHSGAGVEGDHSQSPDSTF